MWTPNNLFVNWNNESIAQVVYAKEFLLITSTEMTDEYSIVWVNKIL